MSTAHFFMEVVYDSDKQNVYVRALVHGAFFLVILSLNSSIVTYISRILIEH